MMHQIPMKMPEAGETAAELANISVSSRVPMLWVDMPRMWFAQVESILAPQKLGDQAKYDFVVARLDREALQQVSDIILSPPQTDKYILQIITIKMGKTYSKEEVIIAQNGAMEAQVYKYNTTITVMGVFMVIIMFFGTVIYCRNRIKNWIKKVMTTNAWNMQAAQRPQPQQASYA